MPTNSSSCLTIKANASLRRLRRGKDRHQSETTKDDKSSSPVGGDNLIKTRRRRSRQLQTNVPPVKNGGERCCPNPSAQPPCDCLCSSSTASTEQLSTASSDDCLSLSFDGCCSSSPSEASFDVSPSKSPPKQGRRRTRKPRSQTVVVNVPRQRQRSSSIEDQDAVDDEEKSRYLAIDCEMVGIGPHGSTSRLARVTVVNWDGEVVYDVHVRVEERVTDYRTFVSGITAEDLLESSGAVSFDEARRAVTGLIRGKILVGHGLRSDFAALGIWGHPWHDVRDTARYEPFMRVPRLGEYNPTQATHVPKKLRTLARDKLGVEIQVEGAPHSPVEDAVAALELYKRHRTKWERAVRYKVERTREIQGSVDATAIEMNQQ